MNGTSSHSCFCSSAQIRRCSSISEACSQAARNASMRPGIGFAVLGAAFLALTGAEAMYADMGHLGCLPIRLGWFGLVLPALLLNYFGREGCFSPTPMPSRTLI